MHVFDEHCSFAGMRVLPAQCMQREVTTLNTRRESSEKFFAVAFDSLPVPHLVSHYWREWIRKGCSVSIFFFNLSSNEKWLSESFATWLLLRFTIIIIFFNWSRLLFGFGSCYRFPEKKSKYFRFYLDSCVIWESSKINSFCSSCITCGNHVFWWQVLSRPNSIGFYRLIFFFRRNQCDYELYGSYGILEWVSKSISKLCAVENAAASTLPKRNFCLRFLRYPIDFNIRITTSIDCLCVNCPRQSSTIGIRANDWLLSSMIFWNFEPFQRYTIYSTFYGNSYSRTTSFAISVHFSSTYYIHCRS